MPDDLLLSSKRDDSFARDLPMRAKLPASPAPLMLAEFSEAIMPCIVLHDMPANLHGEQLERASRQMKERIVPKVFKRLPPSFRNFLYLHAKIGRFTLNATTKNTLLDSADIMPPKEKAKYPAGAIIQGVYHADGDEFSIGLATGYSINSLGELASEGTAKPNDLGNSFFHEICHFIDDWMGYTKDYDYPQYAHILDRFHLALLGELSLQLARHRGVLTDGDALELQNYYAAQRDQLVEGEKILPAEELPPATLKEYMLDWLEPVVREEALYKLENEPLVTIINYAVSEVMIPVLRSKRNIVDLLPALVSFFRDSIVTDASAAGERAKIYTDEELEEAFARSGEFAFANLKSVRSDQDYVHDRTSLLFIPHLHKDFQWIMGELPTINRELAEQCGIPCPGGGEDWANSFVRESRLQENGPMPEAMTVAERELKKREKSERPDPDIPLR